MTEQELDRALAQALDVEPAPDFVARVRARLATEPAPMRWNSWWPVAAAGAAVVALVVGGVFRTEDGAAPQSAGAGVVARVEQPAASLAQAAEGTSVDPMTMEARGSRVAEPPIIALPPSGRSFPEVLISPEDAGAVDLLLAGTQGAVLPARTDEQPLVVAQIDLPPIAVEPLTQLTQIQLGELW